MITSDEGKAPGVRILIKLYFLKNVLFPTVVHLLFLSMWRKNNIYFSAKERLRTPVRRLLNFNPHSQRPGLNFP